MSNYQVGDVIEVEVTSVTDYGFFVKTECNYTGLVHISEISNYFVKNILDYVLEGEHILCEVLEIIEEKHLKLSIKNINYKLIPKYGKIKDTPDGFKHLQMKLPIWIREKLTEIDNSLQEKNS